jgi:ribosomal protein L13
MSKLHFTTKHANEATVKRDWYVVDGTNQTVGRMCSRIAAILRGKNKAYYTPHVDCGDFIVVINAIRCFSRVTSWKTRSTSTSPATPAVKRKNLQRAC